LQPEVISLGEPMLEFNAITKGRLRDVNLFKRSWGSDTPRREGWIRLSSG
jgi:hypothetical protein